GRILGFRRSKRNTKEHTSLLQVEGVNTTESAEFYHGKRVAYVYRAKREIDGSKIRVIWGTVTRSHGNSGVVRAKFRSNLPPKSFGASVRIVSGFILDWVAVSEFFISILVPVPVPSVIDSFKKKKNSIITSAYHCILFFLNLLNFGMFLI
ncbi:60S ribosomal protein L35a-1, partial [Nowakowskiella sp. JEL0078]